MRINWPELTFPPINLWNYPKMHRDFIRINDIIVPLGNISYLSRDKNIIVTVLTDGYESKLTFDNEQTAIDFFNELETKLVVTRASLYDDDEDWEF